MSNKADHVDEQEFFKKLNNIAEAMGFEGVDLSAIAASTPKSTIPKKLVLGFDDGTTVEIDTDEPSK